MFKYILLLLLSVTAQVFSAANTNMTFVRNQEYVIRLNNGDLISGYFLEHVNDEQDGEGIKFQTNLGAATIFFNQIADIRLKEKSYRHSHRVYLLPTAEGVKDNYFISDFELMFLYAGAGIGDWFSVTAGRTIIPYILGKQQISVLNVKFSPFNGAIDSSGKMLHLAVGGNFTWLNDANRLQHLYAAATLNLSRTSLTGSVFYKLGDRDYYDLYFYNNLVPLTYGNGSFGIALGLDSKLPSFESIHIIGEIWNSDVVRPSNSGVMLGTRICNSAMAADFGLAVFTQPFVLPFVSFSWTPF